MRKLEPPSPEARTVTARARHRHYLVIASDALFQDRERHKAAGEPWPEELVLARAAIRRGSDERSEQR